MLKILGMGQYREVFCNDIGDWPIMEKKLLCQVVSQGLLCQVRHCSTDPCKRNGHLHILKILAVLSRVWNQNVYWFGSGSGSCITVRFRFSSAGQKLAVQTGSNR